MGRSYQLASIVTAVCVAAIGAIFWPYPWLMTTRPALPKNISRAKQLQTGCLIFASDHDGRFPVHLSELEPDYVPAGEYYKLRFSSMGQNDDPTFLMDWLYFGAGFTDKNPPRLLIASPQATTTQPKLKRVIVEGNGSGRVLSESEFLPLLEETVRQMRAENEKRFGTPSLKTGLGAEKATAH